MLKPCIKAVGPKNAKLLLVGEAPGEQEELAGVPFVGYSGQELNRMLGEAGLMRSECYLTNVLWTRPPGNKFDLFCVKKAELPAGYSLPAVSQGRYLHPDLLPEIDRLHQELRDAKPNLIVLLGAKALWAVTGQTKISALRGAISESPFGKVLPTYHPSAVQRDWSLRPIVVTDLLKAAREKEFPEIIRVPRFIEKEPTLGDIIRFYENWKETRLLSVDIETKNSTITCIGFGPSKSSALVVPFYDPRQKDNNYWPTALEEREAWKLVSKFLTLPAKKIFQNGLFDLQYLFRMKFRVTNIAEDTMLMHHALFPEMPKGLGFLGSIYTNEAPWKLMRTKEGEKRDD